jgi:lactobin A/cerein 7B family class IIb bacteriocin|tara:strand:- start:250 stop:516 length:267 start_codon:yes stop_codon:yes gene_type:complete
VRELTDEEIEMVNGGVGLIGAGIGAVSAGGSTALGDGSFGEVVGATLLGGAAGFFGGIATSGYSSGLTTAMFGAYSVETGIIAGMVGS